MGDSIKDLLDEAIDIENERLISAGDAGLFLDEDRAAHWIGILAGALGEEPDDDDED